MMKFKLRVCAAIAALGVAVMGQTAQAAAVNGSEALAAVVSGTSDLNAAASMNLTSFIDTGNTGDFSAVSGVVFADAVTVNFTLGSSLTITNSAWGTFTGVLVIDDNSAANARTDSFVGTFTPGTDFPAGTTVNSASLVMSFTQSGGAGNSISDSLSLHSPSVVTVPEPASLAMFGTAFGFFALVAGARRFRAVK
jgi:hypothetical protein